MDSIKMNTRNWIASFVFLVLIPGSTLNAIESAAITTTAKSFGSIPTMTATTTTASISKAIKMLRITSERSFTTTLTTPPMTLHNASNAFNIHSISSTTEGLGTAEQEKAAKSSIMELTKAAEGMKQRHDNVSRKAPVDFSNATEAAIAMASLQFGAKFTTTKSRETISPTLQADCIETKGTQSVARVPNLAEGSTQATTIKNDMATTIKNDMTTKQTKAPFNGTKTVDKMTVGDNATGEKKENIDEKRFDSAKASMQAAEGTTAFSPVSVVIVDTTTVSDSSSKQNDVTATVTSSSAPLLATTLLAATRRDEYSELTYQDKIKNHLTFMMKSNHNKEVYKSSYNQTKGEPEESEDGSDKNNREIDSVANRKNISSSYQQRRETQQQQTHPLQRPMVHKSNNGSTNNNYNYLYHSNNNYYNNQQSANGDLMLRQEEKKQSSQQQLRPQYARQVQQQQNYHLAAMMPLATSATTASIFTASGNSLISDKYSKQSEPNLSKSPAAKYESQQRREQAISPSASNMSLTTITTNSGSSVVGLAAVTLDERAVANTATNVSAFPTVTTTTMKSTTRRPPPTTTPRPTPSIDDYQTVISQAGTHAYLPCNVKQLVKKPISWLRVRDGHILTVDQTTFIADQRFQSIYASNPERWSLQIKYVQVKDEGTYECQVSTEPKSSAIVTLRVVEPRTELIGEPTRHVKAGSQVKLRCIISQALEQPLFINWFHNQKQIYLHSRRGWRTEIERIELPLTEPSRTTTTTSKATASTPTTTTTQASTTREQTEEATTIIGQTIAATAAAATTTSATSAATRAAHSLPNGFDSFSDTLNEDADKGIRQQTSGVGAVSAKGMTIATPTTTISLVSAPSLTSFTVGFGNDNTTSPTLAAMAPAAATMSTALPTVTKTMRWPTTTSTTSTTLAAVEVRQITTASLIIPSVEKQDSGNYTCSPSNSAPKTVVLHVLNGEYSASAITSGVSSIIIAGHFCKWHIALLTFLMQNWHHKLTAFLFLTKFIASALQRYILLQFQSGVHIKRTETTNTALDNVAAITIDDLKLMKQRCFRRMSRKILNFCSAEIRNGTCHPTIVRVDEKKCNKSEALLIGHSNYRREHSYTNCSDLCRSVGLRVEKALHLLATKEKT